jgi:hypothetical protein
MSNVTPFPVRRMRHYIDMVRCHVEAQPANMRKAYLQKIVEQHRTFLANAGVEPVLIERECRDLKNAVSAPPTPKGGLRMAA